MLAMILLLLGLFQAQTYVVVDQQANGYYVAKGSGQYALYFQQENIRGGPIEVGDHVVGVFAKDEEHTLLWVMGEK